MFEASKVGRKVSKATWKAEVPELRTKLLQAQMEARERGLPIIVLVAGMDGAGKGEVVNRLNEWLDARNVQVHAYWDETDEERERPRAWRFWRSMPGAGEIAVMFGGWYLCPLEQSVLGDWGDDHLERELRRIREFERMLIIDGYLIVKFWYHYSEKEQRRRLKKLERDDRSRWRTAPPKKNFSERYQAFEHTADIMVRRTDIGTAPWYIIEATDARYRDLTVGTTLLEAVRQRLAQAPQASVPDAQEHQPCAPPRSGCGA